jgi:Rps23 Pro-64 3,4-dihydroxylase Tpa1-like proline 4-hydroxylase
VKKQQSVRTISLELALDGGHTYQLEMSEDNPELVSLFQVLATRGDRSKQQSGRFFQIPVDGGKAACSFNASQLVSIVTNPPVVVQLEQPARQVEVARQPQPPAEVLHRPGKMIIDDFLGEDEHRDMLAFALANEDKFSAGTVEGQESQHRQNMVIMNFHESAHSKLICNRLLTWLPQITQTMGIGLFPVESVESQLTASNDGHFYGMHLDVGSGDAAPRTLSCVYYFFQEPRPFSGGALRLYDSLHGAGGLRPADTFQEIQPVSNRMVIFASNSYHQLMHTRCPSRQFKDSRFAITNWIRQREKPDPKAAFGWGHLHCGQVPASFNDAEKQT